MPLKKFYDIHMHAFNLSHPSLLPFITRLNLSTYLSLNSIPGVGVIVSRILKSKMSSIINLLAVMERDMGDYFLVMENDLKPLLNNKKQLPIFCQFKLGKDGYRNKDTDKNSGITVDRDPLLFNQIKEFV